jgi:O-antigen/teichoic acid export membrane protein
VIVLAAGGGVRAALIVNTLTSAGQLGAAWLIYRWRFALPVTGPLPPARDLLRRAWPFALAGVLAALQARLGLLLLEQIAGTGETGYYAAASRFVEAGRLAPQALFTALLPALAALTAQPGALSRLFRRVLIGVSLYAGALALALTALAEPALRLAFGAAFVPAAPALVIGAWGLLAALPRAALTLYWYARAGERFVNGVLAAMLAGQAALGLWLIPLHGAAGAALALALAEAGGLAALGAMRRARRQ